MGRREVRYTAPGMLLGDSYHFLDDIRRAVDFDLRRYHGGQAYMVDSVDIVLLTGEQQRRLARSTRNVLSRERLKEAGQSHGFCLGDISQGPSSLSVGGWLFKSSEYGDGQMVLRRNVTSFTKLNRQLSPFYETLPRRRSSVPPGLPTRFLPEISNDRSVVFAPAPLIGHLMGLTGGSSRDFTAGARLGLKQLSSGRSQAAIVCHHVISFRIWITSYLMMLLR